MTNFTPEMIEKAKAVKTAEELLALAKENSIEMTEEEAKAHFTQLNPVSGELSDDELDNVAGGGCETAGGHTVVTSDKTCFTGHFSANRVVGKDSGEVTWHNESNKTLRKMWWANCSGTNKCGNCIYLEFNAGTGYCSKS